jgi:signal transduction histidine kinase
VYDALDQDPLLAARQPSRLQRRLAYGIVTCLLVIFCIVVPHASRQLPPVTAFVPIQATVIIVNDLIIAALLFAQFWVARWTWLLVLASSFLFSALISVPYVLTYPGVFAPLGLLGAGLQTAPWIAAWLHLGSPLGLIIAMLVRGPGKTTHLYQRAPGPAIAMSIALMIAIACGVTWLVLTHDEMLPRVFRNTLEQYQSLSLLTAPILVLDVIALLLLWRRGHSVLDLWLMVMCITWLFVGTLGAALAGSRFSLGWYTARTVQMVATYFVLLLFLSENTALYASLARASFQRRGARQAQQIAMDAAAASIGHEIKQPLTAMLTNASACVLQLRKADPDLEEMRATVTDIAADARRIAQIISSVRTMFTQSTHDRQQLNLNSVVRDVLSTVELELHHYRVIVKTELDSDLPSILADSGQLYQVFLNLITNATEAMIGVTDRPCVLTVTSSIVAGSSDIAVTVEDTGVGIAAKESARIFEPFFSTKVSGTGVGLTICRVIVKAHAGKLEVRANKPYGTIFRVILPTGAYG